CQEATVARGRHAREAAKERQLVAEVHQLGQLIHGGLALADLIGRGWIEQPSGQALLRGGRAGGVEQMLQRGVAKQVKVTRERWCGRWRLRWLAQWHRGPVALQPV